MTAVHRVILTGATGFVGGNVATVLAERGVDVMCAVRRDLADAFPWPWRRTDLADPADLRAAFEEHDATAVLHLAIDNDLHGLYRDRRAGFVARVGGVQGRHQTQPAAAREQDCGFGYFVLSLVEALSAGNEFTVWQDDAINGVASPVTAAQIGARTDEVLGYGRPAWPISCAACAGNARRAGSSPRPPS